MNIIDKILQLEEFSKRPPILLDIGASGEIHKVWRKIAKYAICIAFDADDRDFQYAENNNSRFKKLHIVKRLVSPNKATSTNFYLTKSPYCSSSLEPNIEELNNYAFNELFKVEKVIKLNSTDLNEVMKDLSYDRIDWYKADTQGTDIRIFKSLNEDIIAKILCLDFEPGIIEAYKTEDKVYEIMAFMKDKNFWLGELKIDGTPRISSETKKIFPKMIREFIENFITKSPCWAEMTYFNSLENGTLRDYLLMYVFLIEKKQLGFALDIAIRGGVKFKDTIFQQMEICVRKKIYLKFLLLPLFIFRKNVQRIKNKISKLYFQNIKA